MKINILYNFVKGPYGGGNQFLLALKNYLIKHNKYEKISEKAKIILFNSFQKKQDSKRILLLKSQDYEKIIIMRLDGPVFLIRDKDLNIDKEIYLLNQFLADATIFQSEWSRQENYKLGMKPNRFETVIINAPDPLIFNKKRKSPFSNKRKIKLIATSWSSNWNKGFETYKWLDENLDFSKYEMTFIGNTPINFKNIKHIPPLNSINLAKELKKNDIYITASKKDPCSNSLIEAMHCGLPAIGLRDGGHPEIIKQGGELFNFPEEIPAKITKISKNYQKYQKKIDLPSMKEVGDKYFQFMQEIYEKYKDKEYKPKKISRIKTIKIRWTLLKIKTIEKIKNILKK
jgi:glycosyltransferase involved in cell wall biosynthesis